MTILGFGVMFVHNTMDMLHLPTTVGIVLAWFNNQFTKGRDGTSSCRLPTYFKPLVVIFGEA